MAPSWAANDNCFYCHLGQCFSHFFHSFSLLLLLLFSFSFLFFFSFSERSFQDSSRHLPRLSDKQPTFAPSHFLCRCNASQFIRTSIVFDALATPLTGPDEWIRFIWSQSNLFLICDCSVWFFLIFMSVCLSSLALFLPNVAVGSIYLEARSLFRPLLIIDWSFLSCSWSWWCCWGWWCRWWCYRSSAVFTLRTPFKQTDQWRLSWVAILAVGFMPDRHSSPPSLPPSSNDAGNRFVSQPMLRCQLIKVDWALPVRLYFDWYDRFIPVPETGSQLLGVVVWLAVDATVALTRTLIRSVLVCWWMETRPDLIAPETFIKTISLFLSLSLSLRCLSSDWFISSANADLSPPGSFMHSGVKRRHHLHIVAYSNEWWSTARSDEAPPAPLPENPEESPMPLPAPRRIFQAIGNQPLKLD